MEAGKGNCRSLDSVAGATSPGMTRRGCAGRATQRVPGGPPCSGRQPAGRPALHAGGRRYNSAMRLYFGVSQSSDAVLPPSVQVTSMFW